MRQRFGSRSCAKSTVAPEGTSKTGRRDVGMFQHLIAFAARRTLFRLRCLFCRLEWSDCRVRNQIRREMAVECRECRRVGGRESEADMAIRADQDHSGRSEAGALGSDIGIVRDSTHLAHRRPSRASPSVSVTSPKTSR